VGISYQRRLSWIVAVAAGANKVYQSVTWPSQNTAGQVAFLGDYADANDPSTGESAIFTGLPGALSVLARTGDHAPGTSASTFFDDLDDAAINDLGQLAFTAGLDGPDVVVADEEGIWATDSGLHPGLLL
jgi:hypothetical protein